MRTEGRPVQGIRGALGSPAGVCNKEKTQCPALCPPLPKSEAGMYGAEQGGTWVEPALNFCLSVPDVTTGQASGFAESLPPGPHLPQKQGVAGTQPWAEPSPRFTHWALSRCCVRKRLCCQRGVLCEGQPRWHPIHSLGDLETARCAMTLQPGPVARPKASSPLPSGT